MKRKWQVVAVYAPLPGKTATFNWKGQPTGLVDPEKPSVAAGREFKFTVEGEFDAPQAIEVAKQSGFFLGGFEKHFVFQAIEQFGESE